MAQTYNETEVAMVEITLKLSEARSLLRALQVLCDERLRMDLLVEIENRIFFADEAAIPHLNRAAEEEHMRRESAGELMVRAPEKIAA